jgi:hypothetical protein
VVESIVEPQYTVEPLTKFVPVTASDNVAGLVRLPATAELGVSVVIVGPETVNGLVVETAVAVFWTVILPDPVEASWVLVTYAVRELALL